ncbi:IspD/TarI family cytidylyltransferase [Corynebacterium resistens]|uniref:IspD/TarI family cytidylyltransferase n=1 Tax=Corynebacterium resistens TaxID=258224 RepID=UPI0023539E37|nr:2-C-methyl-D-erythritol 4-phosphate cytidylyltransferase [Corynebacterium resistens]
MINTEHVFALVAAAGSGTRLGFDTPKAFVELRGRTLLERSLDALAESQSVGHAIVLVSQDMRQRAEDIIKHPENKLAWAPMGVGIELGGSERVDSVYAGLLKVQPLAAGRPDSLVLIHDAARCLVPPRLVSEVVTAAGDAPSGAIPVVPVADTIKVIEPLGVPAGHRTARLDGAERVLSTPPRSTLRAAQTPQVFRFDQLLDANERYLNAMEIGSAHPTETHGLDSVREATDDASLMEMAGYEVVAVPGHHLAMKITTEMDYRVAEMLLDGRETNNR